MGANNKTKVKGKKSWVEAHAFISFSSHFAIESFVPLWPHYGEEEDSPLLKILRGDNRQ